MISDSAPNSSNAYIYNNFEVPADDALPFFGKLSEKQANYYLANCRKGTYLLRFSSKIKDAIVFSVKIDDKIENKEKFKHFRISKSSEGYSFGSLKHKNLIGLLKSLHVGNESLFQFPLAKTAEFGYHAANWSLIDLKEVFKVLEGALPKSYLLYEIPSNPLTRMVYFKNAQGEIEEKKLMIANGIWKDEQSAVYLNLNEFLVQHKEVFDKPIWCTSQPTWENATVAEIKRFFKKNKNDYYLFRKEGDEIGLYQLQQDPSTGKGLLRRTAIQVKNDRDQISFYANGKSYPSMRVLLEAGLEGSTLLEAYSS